MGGVGMEDSWVGYRGGKYDDERDKRRKRGGGVWGGNGGGRWGLWMGEER